jgi:predicted DNA-binding antitoxin AbrB/MazE fold protein
MTTIEAIYEKGVFRPVQKVDFEDGERVEITIKSEIEKDPAETIPYLDPAADFSDIAVDSGITDLALNIDHYLYGLPKQSEK